MAIHDRHLTTEQLSALLDDMLSSQERVLCEAHLNTCAQCQQTLTELRQTVALLHALPQPALPRSFVISQDMLSTNQQAGEFGEVREPRVLPFPATRRRTRPGFVFNTLRFASSIAAVIGIILLTASLFSVMPHTMGTPSATSSAGSASSTGSIPVPSASPNGSKSASNVGNGTAVVNNQHGTPLTPSIQPRATQEPRIVGSPAHSPTSSSPWLFVLPDLTTPGGQALLGFVLLILGIAGLLLLRWQWNRHTRAPTYPRQDQR